MTFLTQRVDKEYRGTRFIAETQSIFILRHVHRSKIGGKTKKLFFP